MLSPERMKSISESFENADQSAWPYSELKDLFFEVLDLRAIINAMAATMDRAAIVGRSMDCPKDQLPHIHRYIMGEAKTL